MTVELARRPPATIPVVNPVPEYAADPELLRRYEATKRAFGVPWMGVVAMAHAQYRGFFDALWAGLEPMAATRRFQAGCAAMRAETEGAIAALGAPPIAERLRGLGYGERELDDIRALLDVFGHGNYPYLLMATLSRHLLNGGSLPASDAEVEPSAAPAPSARLVLMEAHHADEATRAIYEDIKATLALPILNTDYRALARWPSYFRLAWTDLRPHIRTAPHAAIAQRLHARAVALVQELPAFGLDAQVLRDAAARDAGVAEVLSTVELFQWLLPELAVNVAFFREQLR